MSISSPHPLPFPGVSRRESSNVRLHEVLSRPFTRLTPTTMSPLARGNLRACVFWPLSGCNLRSCVFRPLSGWNNGYCATLPSADAARARANLGNDLGGGARAPRPPHALAPSCLGPALMHPTLGATREPFGSSSAHHLLDLAALQEGDHPAEPAVVATSDELPLDPDLRHTRGAGDLMAGSAGWSQGYLCDLSYKVRTLSKEVLRSQSTRALRMISQAQWHGLTRCEHPLTR